MFTKWNGTLHRWGAFFTVYVCEGLHKATWSCFIQIWLVLSAENCNVPPPPHTHPPQAYVSQGGQGKDRKWPPESLLNLLHSSTFQMGLGLGQSFFNAFPSVIPPFEKPKHARITILITTTVSAGEQRQACALFRSRSFLSHSCSQVRLTQTRVSGRHSTCSLSDEHACAGWDSRSLARYVIFVDWH